jgi:signal transduction histidine kinase
MGWTVWALGAHRSKGELAALIALAIVYAVTARFGLTLGAVSGFATLVWPPTGIALAALVLGGARLWPGVFIGAFVANLWASAPPLVALGIATGNAAEALTAFFLVRRFGFHAALSRVRDVVALVFPFALASTLVSATVGVLSLYLGGVVTGTMMGATWRAWWLGDVLGALVVAPAILSWGHGRLGLPRGRQAVEVGALVIVAVALGAFVFLGTADATVGPLRQGYMIFPVLIWAALRFGTRGATGTLLLLSALAIAGTAQGSGPFVSSSLTDSLFNLQAFMAVAAIAGTFLAAAVSERAQAIVNRERLLSVVSHDLRSPLGVIDLSVEVLSGQRLAGVPETRDVLARIRRSTRTMDVLIRDLLDESALEAGRLVLAPAPHDARELVDAALEVVRPLAAEKDLRATALGPAGPLTVCCDRDRMLQVFANLLGNAVKFSPRGLPIEVAIAEVEGEVRFSCANQGPPLDAEQRRRVFQPFWQARPNDRRGTGLGLAIAKGIVEMHGGRIWVDSSPATGTTTFHFTLPRA